MPCYGRGSVCQVLDRDVHVREGRRTLGHRGGERPEVEGFRGRGTADPKRLVACNSAVERRQACTKRLVDNFETLTALETRLFRIRGRSVGPHQARQEDVARAL